MRFPWQKKPVEPPQKKEAPRELKITGVAKVRGGVPNFVLSDETKEAIKNNPAAKACLDEFMECVTRAVEAVSNGTYASMDEAMAAEASKVGAKLIIDELTVDEVRHQSSTIH